MPDDGFGTGDETELVVDRLREVAAGVVTLDLRDPAGAPLPAWEPGAHIDLLLGPGLVRQYSLCGDPAERDRWRIAVLRESAGRGGSAHVHERIGEGGKVRARGPRNHFALRPASRYLFVAGGIGITPILPMVAEARARGADWSLLYGGRSRASMAFLDRLERLERVRAVPQDELGLPDLAAFLADPRTDTGVYCCGPPPLLAAVEEQCRSWPPGALHVERFQPVEPERSGDSSEDPFELVLSRSGRTVTVPPGRSVLQAALDAGCQPLYSCTEGTCGTCETDVLEGEPEHRDSVLTEEERAAGDTMMICVSRCRGPRLVLDL